MQKAKSKSANSTKTYNCNSDDGTTNLDEEETESHVVIIPLGTPHYIKIREVRLDTPNIKLVLRLGLTPFEKRIIHYFI